MIFDNNETTKRVKKKIKLKEFDNLNLKSQNDEIKIHEYATTSRFVESLISNP